MWEGMEAEGVPGGQEPQTCGFKKISSLQTLFYKMYFIPISNWAHVQ